MAMAHRLKQLLATIGIALTLLAFVPSASALEPPGIEIVDPTMGQIVSGVYTVRGHARDDVGIASVEISIDGGPWYPANDTSGNGTWWTWSFDWDTTMYLNGGHAITALANDVEGREAIDRVEVQVNNEHRENTPPWVVIHRPSQESHVCGEILVEGHAGDDDPDDEVIQVQVRFREHEWMDARPGGMNGSYNSWFLWLNTNLYDNGWGRLDARSFDGDAYSDIYDVWIKVENPCEGANHRPWVHIDHPAHGATVSGIVVISGRAGDTDDGDKVEAVEVSIGRGAWRAVTPLGPDSDPWRSWATEWNTEEWENGWIAVCARSWDGELYSETHCVEVFIHNEREEENHRPIVHIREPKHGDVVDGFVTIRGTAEDPDEPGDKVEMVWVRIDDGSWVRATDTSGDGSFHTWQRGWNTREWRNGEHRICARSYDGELFSEIKCITVFVHNGEEENERPRVDITHPENGAKVRGLVEIRGTAWDDVEVKWVEWRVNEGPWRDAFDTSGDGSWSTWVGYWHTEEFEDGCYVISARAYDGSLYSELDRIELCVDNHEDRDEPPKVDIVRPECGTVVEGVVVVRGVSSDDREVVLVEVRIDDGPWHEAVRDGPDGGWGEWAYEWDTTLYDDGEHHVHARAQDNGGQYSDIDTCGYLVHNGQDGESPPRLPNLAGMLVPVSSMGLLGFFGAALVRRGWMGSVL
jgi:hypothetical protein